MTIAELYTLYQQHPSIQTDTRKIEPGQMFFALKGPSFNGNQFAADALAKGAAYAVVDEPVGNGDPRIIQVPDTLQTLQQLARHHRQRFSIPFIAITGSNGKTTTKELVHAVLSASFRTYTTEGNLNNHIGIPLTLLKVRDDAEMAVVEMGANHQKEIASYCTYALPTHGIITNCGKAHLEGFGGVEGVRKGKGELYDHLRAHNGTAFAFDDYDYLHDMSRGIGHIEWYGTRRGRVTGEVENADPFLVVRLHSPESLAIHTRLVGAYNLPNVLCAVITGLHFGIPLPTIAAAIESYVPGNSRSQLVEKDSNRIILDAYNANPSSMKAAIENFSKMEAPSKMLFLGGMMELGEESLDEHRAVVELIGKYPWAQVVLVGGDFGRFDHPYQYFPNVQAAKEWFQQQDIRNSYLLVKGSRSMQMEKLLS